MRTMLRNPGKPGLRRGRDKGWGFEQEGSRKREPARECERVPVARRINDGKGAASIANDVLEGVGGKPGIERKRNCAGAHRSEEKLDELCAVADQHGYALAGAHPQTRNRACDRIHARVEIAIGTCALTPAKQINNGDLVGSALRDVIEEKSEIALAVLALHRVKCDRKETPLAILP